MNPTDRLNVITEIALKLQAEYNTSGINILLSGYGIETQDISFVSSKRQYAIDLLKSQSNDTIIKIAKDLKIELPFIQESQQEKQSINMKKKIFISHSSKDMEIVEKLIDTLEAIGVRSELIFCSSFEGYGVPLGDNFLETIKQELNSNILVLFVLSKNFYSSVISLCEMGATWVKTNEHIPILIPPFDYKDVKGVFPNTHGMIINEKAKLNSLKEKVEAFMELPITNFNAWERKRDNILNDINRIINSTELPEYETKSENKKREKTLIKENKNNFFKDDYFNTIKIFKPKEQLNMAIEPYIKNSSGILNFWAKITGHHNIVKPERRFLYITSYFKEHLVQGKGHARYPNMWAILRETPTESVKGNWSFICNGIENKRTIIQFDKELELGWHLFSVEWSIQMDFIKFYIDTKVIEEIPFKNWPKDFKSSMYIGTWPDKKPQSQFYSEISQPFFVGEIDSRIINEIYANRPSE